MENAIVLKINKEEFEITDEKKLFKLCMEFILQDKYKYSPLEAIKKIAEDIGNLLLEGSNKLFNKETINLKRYNAIIKKINIFQRGLEYQDTREKMTTYLYEQLLRQEGCGLLHGMGFANKFGDRLNGDSEKQSTKL
jgi:hypothetical protein